MPLDDTLEIYRKLILIRRCQEVIVREYPSDEIKTPVHLGIWLEGISVGTTHPLPSTAKVFGPMRVHGLYLAMTGETDRYFAELYGKATGVGGGKAGSMHLTAPDHGLIATSGIVGSTVSLAVGAALANKYQGNDHLVLSTFGDSVPETGEFWESLNFACLHQLRIIFVCEDNGLAAQVDKQERHGFNSFVEAVSGFRCHVLPSIDGSDVRNVINHVESAMRVMDANTPAPAVLHFPHLRFLEHVGPNTDFDRGYHSKPADFNKFDPIVKYRQFLFDKGYRAASLQDIVNSVGAQIESSIAKAKSDPFPTSTDFLHGVFA